MLSTNYLILFLVIAGVILLTVLFIKFPTFRLVILTIFYILFVAFSVFAFFQVDSYYSASGGIFGSIENIIKPNTAKVTSMVFKLDNLMFTATGEENCYSVIIESNEVLELTSDTKYMVLVNDTPTQIINGSVDYINTTYNYKFYSDENQSFNDDLHIQFGFYKNSTTILIETDGGSKAVEYWNYYFNKNNFDIKIEPVKDLTYYETTITDYEDLIKNISCVKFYDHNHNELSHNDYYIGSTIENIPEVPTRTGYNCYWSLDGETPFDFTNFILTEEYGKYDFYPLYIAQTVTVSFYDVDQTTLLRTEETVAGTKLNDLEFVTSYVSTVSGYKWAPTESSEDVVSEDPNLGYYIYGNCSFYLKKFAIIA